MTFHNFIKQAKNAFSRAELPGLDTQLTMSPITREVSSYKHTNSPRKSAVLIFFYPVDGKPHIAMMKRAADNTVHSQQISFPGGKSEEYDKSLTHTALREANEELGIDINKVYVIGNLSKLYIPPSNFDVYPIVGYSETKPEFVTNAEVDKLLEVDFSELLNPENKKIKTIIHKGNKFDVPCFYIQNQIIWGATAMILAELLSVVREEW